MIFLSHFNAWEFNKRVCVFFCIYTLKLIKIALAHSIKYLRTTDNGEREIEFDY